MEFWYSSTVTLGGSLDADSLQTEVLGVGLTTDCPQEDFGLDIFALVGVDGQIARLTLDLLEISVLDSLVADIHYLYMFTYRPRSVMLQTRAFRLYSSFHLTEDFQYDPCDLCLPVEFDAGVLHPRSEGFLNCRVESSEDCVTMDEEMGLGSKAVEDTGKFDSDI